MEVIKNTFLKKVLVVLVMMFWITGCGHQILPDSRQKTHTPVFSTHTPVTSIFLVSTHSRKGRAGKPSKFWIMEKGAMPDKAPVSTSDFKAA